MGYVLAIILYLLFLMVTTMALLALGTVTFIIGIAIGIVKGISHTLEIYFGTFFKEIGGRQ